jgi:hypothetical protein
MKERMWLLDFAVKAGAMSLVGISQSEVDINSFQEDLTRNVLLKNVFLEESESIQIDGQYFTRFKMNANLEKNK